MLINLSRRRDILLWLGLEEISHTNGDATTSFNWPGCLVFLLLLLLFFLLQKMNMQNMQNNELCDKLLTFSSLTSAAEASAGASAAGSAVSLYIYIYRSDIVKLTDHNTYASLTGSAAGSSALAGSAAGSAAASAAGASAAGALRFV